MRLLTKIDRSTPKEQYLIMGAIIILLIVGFCVEVFSPSDTQILKRCAFDCEEIEVNKYDNKTCWGTDPTINTTITFELDRMSPMYRMMDLYFQGYLHPSEFETDDEHQYPVITANASLYYLGEDDEWVLWKSMELQSSFECDGNGLGTCEMVKWIKEPYFMHAQQKLEITMLDETHKIGNICFHQYMGTDSYGVEKTVFCVVFTMLCVFYIVFYFIYLRMKGISVKELDAVQYLNIGLMFVVLLYNDPLNLLNLIFPSPFFPILHCLTHIIYICYLVIFIVKTFGVLTGKKDESGYAGGKKWIPTIICTLGLLLSFAYASSLYLKGMTENPFNITIASTMMAKILYGFVVFFVCFLMIWLIVLFFTTFSAMYKTENTRHCMYFILLSFIVLMFEFGMLLYSDYSSFYNSVSVPMIVIFETNIYLLAMFYLLLPLGPNEYAEVGSLNDDEKGLFAQEEPEVPMGGVGNEDMNNQMQPVQADAILIDTNNSNNNQMVQNENNDNEQQEPMIVNVTLKDDNVDEDDEHKNNGPL